MILALLMSAALSGAEPPSAEAVPTAEKIPVSAPLQNREKRIKMICVTDTKTGSRFTRKTCYPLDEWNAKVEASRQIVSDYQMAPQTNPGVKP
ncbi:MAG: hypothetical protein Q8K11_01545 [Phenylobacterium sp.]|uniref:hypothetical protein n=1 Tax=Phenylobacterium sp. TaxID=1871053 RepID=UPI002731587E|nr:hypothetical protein [Phenylobacterium sp.]MDP2008836.1 hypothetical protein [Phenylobacterium sp.]MDP3866993.1 hypothetical protein [Phenylobacterium sp.]